MYLTMLTYLLSIFYASDVLFFDVTGTDCTPEQLGHKREWIVIEITTFYVGIVSGIFFAISAKFFKKVPDSVMLGESPDSALAKA